MCVEYMDLKTSEMTPTKSESMCIRSWSHYFGNKPGTQFTYFEVSFLVI
jgi:hypothetical protein